MTDLEKTLHSARISRTDGLEYRGRIWRRCIIIAVISIVIISLNFR